MEYALGGTGPAVPRRRLVGAGPGPSHNRILGPPSLSCPGAKELYLGKEGRHLLSGVRQEAEVIRVSEDKLPTAAVVIEADAGSSLEEPNQGTHN